MNHSRKVDANQREIVQVLRAVGCSVEDTHELGKGFPDLCVGFRGRTFLLEVKAPGGKLNDRETMWFDSWRGQACVVRTVTEALVAIGAVQTKRVAQ